MTCSQSTLLAAVPADCAYSEVNLLCLYSRSDTCRPCISYAWVQQQSRTQISSPSWANITAGLLRLGNVCIGFRQCCTSSLPHAHPSFPALLPPSRPPPKSVSLVGFA